MENIILFEIKDILELKGRGVVILVKSVEDNVYFELTDNLKLGGCELKKEIDIPRRIDIKGNSQENSYILTLKNKQDKDKLEIGQIVEMKS